MRPAVFWLVVFLFVVMFVGDPDLHDAIVKLVLAAAK